MQKCGYRAVTYITEGEEFPKSSNTGNQARADVSARGLWINEQTAFRDVNILKPLARCGLHHSLPAVYKKNEKEKKRKYNQQTLQVEHHLWFHVLIMFWMGRECSNFLLHTAERLATGRKGPKIKISAWIKARLSFVLIRNMLLCLRVIRTSSNVDNISKICLCAIVAESNIKMNHLQIHSMLLHDCKYVSLHILFVLFLYNFCIYTQSTADLGLNLIFVRIDFYLKKNDTLDCIKLRTLPEKPNFLSGALRPSSIIWV